MATIRKVTNGNLYINGNNLVGKVEELTMPELTSKTAEIATLGMAGTTEYHSGFEKMEMTVKVSAYHEDLIGIIGDPNAKLNMILFGEYTDHTPTGTVSTPFNIQFIGSCKQIPMGVLKAHERVTVDLMFAVYSCELNANGASVLKYNAESNVYKVNGVDKLASFRNNLGL